MLIASNGNIPKARTLDQCVNVYFKGTSQPSSFRHLCNKKYNPAWPINNLRFIIIIIVQISLHKCILSIKVKMILMLMLPEILTFVVVNIVSLVVINIFYKPIKSLSFGIKLMFKAKNI